jgi:hypothetical protein
MDFEEKLGLGSLAYFTWQWLNGEYDDGCCLGCVLVIVAGLVGVGLLVYFLW